MQKFEHEEQTDFLIEKIKELCKKYEEIIAYLIVGGLTTVVSWAAKFIANAILFGNKVFNINFTKNI